MGQPLDAGHSAEPLLPLSRGPGLRDCETPPPPNNKLVGFREQRDTAEVTQPVRGRA